jgi:hypothetical protein
MKFLLVILSFFISAQALDAQRIRVNGDIKTRSDIPIPGVLVVAFENSTLLKSYVSDDKGEYSFNVDQLHFDILYYKPGMHSHSFSVNNKLNSESQGMSYFIQMDDSLAETAVDLGVWLQQHHLTAAYLDSIYTEEIRKQSLIPEKHSARKQKQLMKDALAEQKRFANYKETTAQRTINHQQSQVTSITIGMDHYQMITSAKGEKKYFKNRKPIADYTYQFETTRRYSGVLKDSKNVKKIDKYQPQQHVKG